MSFIIKYYAFRSTLLPVSDGHFFCLVAIKSESVLMVLMMLLVCLVFWDVHENV